VSPTQTAKQTHGRADGADSNGKRLTEKQSVRRQNLIKTAMMLASEGGYDAVQMRDVAAKAQVALGTLYRYFPSKDHLLVAALGEWAGEMQNRVVQRPPRAGTPADRVADVLRRAARAMERAPQLTAALATALTNLSFEDPAAAGYARSVYETMAATIGRAMEDGDRVQDHETVIRILGHVWLAALVATTRGWETSGQMAEDLADAARLLIRT
jgi:TetR/AcrR family transcriptional regulator, cholesterol catabolism regulator